MMNALRVLLIDSEPAVVGSITAALSSGSHTVLDVPSVDEGREALLMQKFDAVLLGSTVREEGVTSFVNWLRGMEQKGRDQSRTPVLSVSPAALHLSQTVDGVLPREFDALTFANTVANLADIVTHHNVAQQGGEQSLDLPVFDPQEFEAQVAYDRELMVEIIDLFLEERTHALIAMSEALASRDFEQLTRVAHTIKGSLSSLHALRARSRAQDVEIAAKNGDERACTPLLTALEHDLELLEPELLSVRSAALAA